ncbi:MAG: sigma-54-dependent Fis family transcriptional regulator [Deltaproteobacteria bacterium]|nr:MAG: sigma-54-dependent Fis family transcriptional regulator [Deltaproteobacteria bacterium]
MEGLPVIVGQSEAMRELFDLIEKVSRTDSTVLISGESGTGKELVARAIHYKSPRRSRPLVAVNCAALPEELLESELFGHVRGAFTGAVRDRRGRFELADRGTIFLDEVSEMSPALQVKLLRVLQEREFERVGDTRTVRVDIRVIAATNQDLEELVRQGRFREDLYYRLNVIPIHIPPLRERKSDIPLLLLHFLKAFNALRGGRVEGFSPEAMNLLMEYDWPGNVRELENLVERLVVLKGEGMVRPEDLPEKIREGELIPSQRGGEKGTLNLSRAVSEFEKRLIIDALRKANGVKSEAARLLGIKRTTLLEKMKRQKIEYPISGAYPSTSPSAFQT